MPNVLISGGSGLIGSKLADTLSGSDWEVRILTRSEPVAPGQYKWAPARGEIDITSLADIDYIINLAGANIGAGRWTGKRKSQILQSRIDSLRTIKSALQSSGLRPKAIVSASAIGYYGSLTDDKPRIEDSRPGPGFLSEVCRAWEAEAEELSELTKRLVILRIPVVLAEQGALQRMSAPVRLGIGSALGHGRQYMPWVHINDLVAIVMKSCSNSNMNGIYNAVAPQNINNLELTHEIAAILGKKIIMPKVPGFVLRLALGEMADMILEGCPVSSEKLLVTGFEFSFPDIGQALDDLLG